MSYYLYIRKQYNESFLYKALSIEKKWNKENHVYARNYKLRKNGISRTMSIQGT